MEIDTNRNQSFNRFHSQQFQHISFDIFIVLVAISVGVSNLFLYCFLGKVASESYEKMANALYKSDWTSLSNNYQKYFIVMIAHAQKPVFYHGFGMAIMNLQTFNKVS